MPARSCCFGVLAVWRASGLGIFLGGVRVAWRWRLPARALPTRGRRFPCWLRHLPGRLPPGLRASANRTPARHGVGDPERGVAKPARGVGKPERGVAESARGVADPARGVAEPARGVADPARGFAEPDVGSRTSAWGCGVARGSGPRRVAESARGVAESARGVPKPDVERAGRQPWSGCACADLWVPAFAGMTLQWACVGALTCGFQLAPG